MSVVSVRQCNRPPLPLAVSVGSLCSQGPVGSTKINIYRIQSKDGRVS